MMLVVLVLAMVAAHSLTFQSESLAAEMVSLVVEAGWDFVCGESGRCGAAPVQGSVRRKGRPDPSGEKTCLA